MNLIFSKKSQGEIFGIALFFVVIIVGIILYGRIASFNVDDDLSQKAEKYGLLSEGTLNTVLKLSTRCEKNIDTIKEMINFCLDSRNINDDPSVFCDDGSIEPSCDYAKRIIANDLEDLFTNGIIGSIPYEFEISLPDYPSASINANFSNLAEFNITDPKVRRQKGYKKAPSGRISWITSRRNVNFELNLYYK